MAGSRELSGVAKSGPKQEHLGSGDRKVIGEPSRKGRCERAENARREDIASFHDEKHGPYLPSYGGHII